MHLAYSYCICFSFICRQVNLKKLADRKSLHIYSFSLWSFCFRYIRIFSDWNWEQTHWSGGKMKILIKLIQFKYKIKGLVSNKLWCCTPCARRPALCCMKDFKARPYIVYLSSIFYIWFAYSAYYIFEYYSDVLLSLSTNWRWRWRRLLAHNWLHHQAKCAPESWLLVPTGAKIRSHLDQRRFAGICIKLQA